jgi:hypothetical protein
MRSLPSSRDGDSDVQDDVAAFDEGLPAGDDLTLECFASVVV